MCTRRYNASRTAHINRDIILRTIIITTSVIIINIIKPSYQTHNVCIPAILINKCYKL